MKQFHNVNRSSGMPVLMGERPGQKDMSETFLKVETEVDARTDSGKLSKEKRHKG